MDESLQTPGVVGGARSRSPGVGAEVTSELSHYPLLDTSSTGWNEDNTRDEVNGSRDWVRQLDYLLVNSWSLQSPSDFSSETLLSDQPTEQVTENIVFEALTGVMSESLVIDDVGHSQNSLANLEKVGTDVENKRGTGTKTQEGLLNGKATPLGLSQLANGEMSLSQHPVGEMSLSQHPNGEMLLSQHPNGEVSLSQHPIDDLTLSQHPYGDASLSQHPIVDLTLSQHPISQHACGEMSLTQYPIGEASPLEHEASLSQYPLAGVSGLSEKPEMSSLMQYTITSEQSPIMADDSAQKEHNLVHRPITDDEVDSGQQQLTSGYSSQATIASQSSNGQKADDNFISSKSDTSVDHEIMLSCANAKDSAQEKLMSSTEIVGHVTIYQGSASQDGSTKIAKIHSEEFCKPSKVESDSSQFDSGRSESSMSSQSQPSVVGVQLDHKVAIAGHLWSGENSTPGLDLMLNTPTDEASEPATQRSKVRQPVCTSTPSSGNDSGGSQENIPQCTLIKEQVGKLSLDSLVGHGPDSGCGSLAPSIIASQSCVSSADGLSQQAPSGGDLYITIGERARLLTEGTETGGDNGDSTADNGNKIVSAPCVATVDNNEVMLAQAMSSYEDELIKTANELGISTEMAKSDLMGFGVECTSSHALVDTEGRNAKGTLGSIVSHDVGETLSRSMADQDLMDQKVLQNGHEEFRHLEQAAMPHLETEIALERTRSSSSRSTAASIVQSRSLSDDSGMSRSSGALAETVRSLNTSMDVPAITAGSRGTVVSFGGRTTNPELMDAKLTRVAQDDPQMQRDAAERSLLNRPPEFMTDAIFNLPDKVNSGGSPETTSTTSDGTLCSMDKDVERIANEYIAILKSGVQHGTANNDSISGNVGRQQDGGNQKYATERTFSQYSDSSATTYNDLPHISEIANTHTVVVVTENANGSVDGSTHGSSSSDTEDALDRDVRRILAKYGRTLSDDEGVGGSKAGKKNWGLPIGTQSDSDDASSLSRRVHHLLNSGTETEITSSVQQLYLFDDPARSMSVPTGSSSSANSAAASLKQVALVVQNGIRDGARTPSPQSVQSSDSLGQRIQTLLVGPDSRALPLKHGHASSVSSQSSVIDYTNLERELDEIQSSLASITSADGLRSRHGSISSQVSENIKTGHTMANLASTYTFQKDTDGDGYAVPTGQQVAAPEARDNPQKFNVNPMLTSGLVPVDVALDIMHGTAAFANNRSTGTVSSHQSAGDNNATGERMSIKDAYVRDRNNSNAARDSSMYSSDNDGDSVRLMGNDQVQDVSRLVAEILERGSPPRQAYRYLQEAEQHERSLDSRKTLGDRSTELLPDSDLFLSQSHVSAVAATPSGAVGISTMSNSFNISPLSYTPLNAFRTAHSLFSTQLSKIGSGVESVLPMRRHPEDTSPSMSQKMAGGEGHLRDEDVQLGSDRKWMSAMNVNSNADDHSFAKEPIERAHQHSPFRGQSTFSDNPVPATGGASRYSSILPDTTSLTEKTATSPSRPRSAIRAREYERELERTSAATSGQSVLERRPKSSSPMLRPYRPVGSQEYYYVESWADDGSVSMAMSETTVESTHAGSDDARAPLFPSHVLGSRKDSPQNAAGIYSHHRTSPNRELSPPSGGQRLGTIPEQSFESRDTDVAQKQQLRHPPEVTLDKERSFHQTREWLNSGSFATRRHDNEADTSGSIAAQNSSAASGADTANVNRRTLSPPDGRHEQNDLLNSTMFATPQKYGTSFRAATSSPRDGHLVESTVRKQFEEKALWRESKRDDASSPLHHTEHHRRCHSVNPCYGDSQGYTRSKEVSTRRCYSETPNDRDKFSPLPVDEIEDDGRKATDHTPRIQGAGGDHMKVSSPHRFRGSTGQLASIRSSLPAGQAELDDHQRSPYLSTRFQSHVVSAERNRYATNRPERPWSTGSIGMLDEGQGHTRKASNRYLSEQRSAERTLPGTRIIGERSRLLGAGDLDTSPRYKADEVNNALKSKSTDVTNRHRAAIYEQHADVMSRMQVSPPRDQLDKRRSDWNGRDGSVPERSRESEEEFSRQSHRTAYLTIGDAARQSRSFNTSVHEQMPDSAKENSHARLLTTEPRHDTRYDVISTHDTPLTRDPISTRDTTSARDPTFIHDPIQRRDPPPDKTHDRSMNHDSTLTREPAVTFNPRHDRSLPLGINELWRRFQDIEITLDTLRSTSNSDTSRIIDILQSQVRAQGGASTASSPLRIDIPAREFRRSSPGGTTAGGDKQTDGTSGQRHTGDIQERRTQANVTVDEMSKPSYASFKKTPDRALIRNGYTNEARHAFEQKGDADAREITKYQDSGSKTPVSENIQNNARNIQSHNGNRQSHERNAQNHEGNTHNRERNMQSHDANKSQNNTTVETQNRQVENRGRLGSNWNSQGEDKGRKEKNRPAGSARQGNAGNQPNHGGSIVPANGVEGKTKKTAWLIKDETLLSIPEDTTLDSLSSDFTTTTAALSTTSDMENDGQHLVVTRTSKRHLPDDPRLLRLQQKIWRQKEMYRRELQREKRRREKIHKLERLLAEKAQQRRGGSSDTPSTGATESLDTASDITTITTSAQLSDDGGNSTLVEEDSNMSTEVVCICHCMKSKTERKTSPITLQEVDYVKTARKVNRQQRHLESESVMVHRSKRRSPSRRSEDAENQPRQHTGGKRQNGTSGPASKRDFGATFPSPMVVSPAVRRTRSVGDVVMVSEAIQTSRPTSPTGQNGQEKGGNEEGRQLLQSYIQPPPYGKMQLTLEKAKLLAAAVDDSNAVTAHPGGFSWFVPVKKGEKPWKQREPLREFQENVPKDAWPPHRSDPSGESGDIDRGVSGKKEELFAPFNQWTIEKPEKASTLQDAFTQKMQGFISRSHERMRHMGLKAEERHVQELHRVERMRLFGTACGGNVLDERLPRSSHKTADPYAEHLFKPKRRSLTRHEMKKRTSRVYTKVSEVTAQVQEKKRQESYKTNRLRAQLYKQKILNQVLNKRGPLIE